MRYIPGQWYAMVAGSRCAVVPGDFPADRRDDMWRSIEDGDGIADILQHVIVAPGVLLSNISPFAVIIVSDSSVNVAVKGPLRIIATTEDGDVVVDGQGVATWREESLNAVTSMYVTVDAQMDKPEDMDFLPLKEGTVCAVRVDIIWAKESPVATQSALDSPKTHIPHAPIPVPEPPADVVPPIVAGEQKSSEPDPAPIPEPPIVVPVAEPTESAQDAGSHVPTGYTTVMPDVDEDDDTSSHMTTYFSGLLFGGAGVNDPGDAQLALSGSGSGGQQSQPHPKRRSGNDDDHDGMTILSLDSIVDDDDDHDGMTVLDAPRALIPGVPNHSSPAPIVEGPVVLARVCANCSTPHSTRATMCKRCGAQLFGDAIQIPRPPLGLAQLPSGEHVAIGHPIIMGRRPEATRFSHNDVPVVVTINDPHVSSTHLKVDLEDWSVLVTNMGRNGTSLSRPGQPDRMLSDGEQVIAQAGDVYRLGPGIAFSILELA